MFVARGGDPTPVGALLLSGDPIEALLSPPFKMIRKPVYSNTSYAHFNFIKKRLLSRPVIDPIKRVRCGHCVDACPAPDRALRFDRGRRQPPVYHYERCIRCYCCHEMCPPRAIDTRTPLPGRILGTAIFVGIQERQIPGYRGIYLLRRDLGDEVEFVTIMWFDSIDAVRAFAGEDYETAVVPPKARAVLSRYDARSQHYHVKAKETTRTEHGV